MQNHPLHEQALSLAKRYLQTEAALIDVLQKIQAQKIFLQLGYASLFQYCVEALKLAENQAYTLIGVSRKCREIPELQKAISTGHLNASRAKRILPVVNNDNASLWIEKASTLPQKEVERQVAATNPKLLVQERVKPVCEDRSMLVAGISDALKKKIARIRELEAQSTSKPCGIEEALDAMASYYLQRKDPLEKAARALTSRQVAGSTAPAIQDKACSKRTALPAHIKHSVVSRDQATCQFRLPTGKLCGAKQWVDIHHIQPVSDGGTNTPENLIHLCRSHHRAAHHLFETQRA